MEALINSELFLDGNGFICLWHVKYKQRYAKLLTFSSEKNSPEIVSFYHSSFPALAYGVETRLHSLLLI
jgi:hypothetical protein